MAGGDGTSAGGDGSSGAGSEGSSVAGGGVSVAGGGAGSLVVGGGVSVVGDGSQAGAAELALTGWPVTISRIRSGREVTRPARLSRMLLTLSSSTPSSVAT